MVYVDKCSPITILSISIRGARSSLSTLAFYEDWSTTLSDNKVGEVSIRGRLWWNLMQNGWEVEISFNFVFGVLCCTFIALLYHGIILTTGPLFFLEIVKITSKPPYWNVLPDRKVFASIHRWGEKIITGLLEKHVQGRAGLSANSTWQKNFDDSRKT